MTPISETESIDRMSPINNTDSIDKSPLSKVDSIDKADSHLSVDHHATINDFVTETRPWYKVPHLRLLIFNVFIVTLTSTNNGFDGSLLNGLQSLNHWQSYFSHPTGSILGALSNGVTFGNIISVLIAPYLADRFGRLFVIRFGQAITVLGAVLQGLSTNYAFFLCSRIVIGLGSGIATVGSPTLISEISYPNHRAMCTFAYNLCWYLGAVIASWVTYGTRNISSNYSWRIPSYLQGIIPVIQLAFLFWVPESPRFLVAKGRVDEARTVLSRWHTGSSTAPRDLAFVEFELNEIQSAIAHEKLTSDSKYTDFITKRGFRKRIFLVVFTGVIMQLSGNGLVSYYLNKVLNSIGITEESKQLEINGCLMIYNLVISCAVCVSSGYFKRRTLFLTCISGMLLCYVIWTVLSAINQQRNFEQASLGNGVLAMIFFYYAFYDIGVNGLPFLYVTEIMPYSHRAKGMNIFTFTQQVVLLYNGFVNPIAMDAIEWKYYIVYCCILVVELAVVYLFYPETSGRTLEEVAEVFGDDAQIDLTAYKNAAVTELDSKKRSLEHVEHV